MVEVTMPVNLYDDRRILLQWSQEKGDLGILQRQ